AATATFSAAPARAASDPLYLAEGYTGAGFQEYLTLENSGAATSVTLTYLFSAAPPATRHLALPATSRTTVNVNSDVGPGREVSVTVDAGGDPDVFVERPMYFHACVQEALCASGSDVGRAEPAATSWDFAEGYTGPGFQEFLTLLNPGSAPAHVAISYLFEGGGQLSQEVLVPPTSRATVNVNTAVGPDRAVSAHLQSDVPIAAERPMYFRSCPASLCTDGGDVASGLSPATSFSFAEGTTRPGFQEFLSLENPGSSPAAIQVQYLPGPGQGAPLTRSYLVAPLSRHTVNVNSEVGPGLDLSMELTSSVPVVAERPLYFSFARPGYSLDEGATDGPGLAPSPTWDFAEGYTGSGFQEYLTLFDPSSAPTSATITYMLGVYGTLQQQVALPALTRVTVDVGAAVGPDREVSAHVAAPLAIVAERPMYFEGCLAGSDVCDRPASFIIPGVPFHQQVYELSCEEAALQMALGKEGVQVTQTQLLERIGVDWRAAYRDALGLHWGDPYRSFVGDPNGSEIAMTGYGTYLTTIERVAAEAGGTVVDAGVGMSPATLYGHVLDGHPVVAWVSFDWRYHAPGSWIAFDGRRIPSLAPLEHAVAVVGVTPAKVLVDNPWSGPQWVSRATFEAAFAGLGRMAVALA
ncbi:MAG: C39 family peptidase, partial [Candidatus Dormibacterales bacterium]